MRSSSAAGLGRDHPTDLLAPAVVRHVGDAEDLDDLRHLPASAQQDVGVAELPNDLFGVGQSTGAGQGGQLSPENTYNLKITCMGFPRSEPVTPDSFA